MNLLKKLFSFSIGSIVAMVIGILSLPILTRILDPSAFGKATLFLNIGLVLTTLSLAGLDQAFIRFFYENEKLNLFKKTLLASSGLTIILTIFIFIFDNEISSLISKDTSYSLLLTFYMVSIVLFRFSNLILRMLQLGLKFSVVEVCRKVFEFSIILFLSIFLFSNHYSIIIGTIISLNLATIISLLLSLSFWRNDETHSKKVNYNIIFKYSLPLMISGFITVVFQTMDKVLLGLWTSLEEVGIYSATFKLIALLNIIQHSFTLFWTPVYLEAYKNNKNNKELYSKMNQIVSFTMLTVGIVIVMFRDIISLFLGEEFRSTSSIISMLIFMPILFTIAETTSIGINLKLKTKYHVITSVILVIINIALCLTFIPIYGAKGAAFSVGVSYFMLYLLKTIFGQRLYKFNIKFKETIFILSLFYIWSLLILFDIKNVDYIGLLIFVIIIYIYKELLLNLKDSIKVFKKGRSG